MLHELGSMKTNMDKDKDMDSLLIKFRKLFSVR